MLLTVYRDGSTGTLVYSGTRGALAVGDAWAVSFIPPAPVGQMELWAQVDPANAIAELDESNNLAVLAVEISYRLYLPFVSEQAVTN